MKLVALDVHDVRFPTSDHLDGSDAMNTDPDYSAVFVFLRTDSSAHTGVGFTFTIGRGTEVVAAAARALARLLVGHELAEFTRDMGAFWRHITGDSQLRWIGPEKGVIHLATAACVNAVWDLWAKTENKPVWKLVADMTPEEFVRCIDFRYIRDAVTEDEALAMLHEMALTKGKRETEMRERGYPAYTTSAGWLGYSDEKVKQLTLDAVDAGWTHIKLKVGRNLDDDLRRLRAVREAVGDRVKLMVDANQVWDVPQAIAWCEKLKPFNLYWIEEPTSPDDVLGHAAIRKALGTERIATGEHCQNRVLFKQLMQAGAIDVCQIDSCRLGGVNEVLAVLLMAHKFRVPVCPHAGGVGLCELVQHLALIDYICISGRLDEHVLEFVDHLHEHFVHPCVIVRGRYIAPTDPGYSADIKPETLLDYEYPNGRVWTERRARHAGGQQ